MQKDTDLKITVGTCKKKIAIVSTTMSAQRTLYLQSISQLVMLAESCPVRQINRLNK